MYLILFMFFRVGCSPFSRAVDFYSDMYNIRIHDSMMLTLTVLVRNC